MRLVANGRNEMSMTALLLVETLVRAGSVVTVKCYCNEQRLLALPDPLNLGYTVDWCIQ